MGEIVTTSAAMPEPTGDGKKKWMCPQNIEDAMRLADILAKSSLVPDSYRSKPGDIMVAVMMGGEVGLAPMAAMQNIAVISGKPCLYGDALLAVVLASGLLENIEEHDPDAAMRAKAGCCIVTRKGMKPHTVTFSMDDAARAGLLNKSGPWRQYPGRMLMMRARAFALRDRFADVLRGFASAEEVADYQPRDVPIISMPRATDEKPLPAPVQVEATVSKMETVRDGFEAVTVTGWTRNANSKGRPYWRATFADGRQCITFSTTFGEMVEAAAGSGAELRVKLEAKEKDGATWYSISDIDGADAVRNGGGE